MNYKPITIRILAFIGLTGIILALLNAPYLLQQARFYLGQVPKAEQTVIPTGEPDLLQIASLGIKAPIRYVDQADEAVFQEALKTGVVHYPGTAAIGEPGNPYIFGHSSDYAFTKGDYKTVFALLPKIEIGAEIVLSDRQGRQFTYVVFDKFVAEKDNLGLLDQKDYKEKLLTLQTSYPIGTALKRFIVVSRLKE